MNSLAAQRAEATFAGALANVDKCQGGNFTTRTRTSVFACLLREPLPNEFLLRKFTPS
jgi:hypothetical protein